LEVYSVSDLPYATGLLTFLRGTVKGFSLSRNLWQKAFLAIHVMSAQGRCAIRSSAADCSVTAAILQHLKVGKNCCRELQRLHQRFCSPLQLELSCCLASKMLLNSCNLAVQLF